MESYIVHRIDELMRAEKELAEQLFAVRHRLDELRMLKAKHDAPPDTPATEASAPSRDAE